MYKNTSFYAQKLELKQNKRIYDDAPNEHSLIWRWFLWVELSKKRKGTCEQSYAHFHIAQAHILWIALG